MNVNKVTLMGRLGAKPEIKSFNNGGKIANMRIATSEKYTDKSTQEVVEKTEWHNITVSGDGLVNLIERAVDKGTAVYIEGSLQTRKWTDQAGAERYTTEIKVAGPRSTFQIVAGGIKAEGNGDNYASTRPAKASNEGFGGASSGGFGGSSRQDFADLDGDIPF